MVFRVYMYQDNELYLMEDNLEMVNSKEQQINQMIQEGKTIVQVCDALNLEWRDVADYLEAVDKTSWLGAKRVITNRLKWLAKESDPQKREIWAAEADKWVDYLYYDGKRLGKRVDKVRRAINNASNMLDE